MADNEIRFLGDLQRLDLKPGDRFVLVIDRPVSMEMGERIQSVWRDFVGGDVEEYKLLILEQGMKIGVISTGEGA